MPPIRRLLLLCALCWPVVAGAKEGCRDDVARVATAIESHYFDPVRGRQIAVALNEDAARAQFDASCEPRRLAEALTTRLKPLDRHFRVTWSAPGFARSLAEAPRVRRRVPAGDAPADGGPRMRRMDPGPVSPSSGIRKVEMLSGSIGYLGMAEFAHFEPGEARQPAREAIEAALDQLASARALIIDLRDNRGGSPKMVGYLVSAFTPPGAKIYNTFRTRDRNVSEAPAQSHRQPNLDVPVYILINARTGSAAESFAYTMKSAGRAKVVGEASGGAANPGAEQDAGHGFMVFVPTGSPVNPITGTNWEGVGVQPDVPAAADSALEVALSLARGYKAGSSDR